MIKNKTKSVLSYDNYVQPISTYLKQEIEKSRKLFSQKSSKSYTSKSIFKSLGL